MRSEIQNAKTIVVKVGTSTLTYENGKLNLKRMEQIARILTDVKNSGKKVVLVTSGAIGVGMAKMGLGEKPEKVRVVQAVSAVGQCELMSIYDRLFSEYNTIVGQILMTKDVIANPERRENAVNTFSALLEHDILPIVNENDSVSVDEIKFGDNDTLSSVVAMLVEADTLLILSDIDGLYDSDPRSNENARIIPQVEEITDQIKGMACGAGSKRGTGGMITKLMAAEMATASGIDVVIANGKDPHIVYRILEGKEVGTIFKGRKG